MNNLNLYQIALIQIQPQGMLGMAMCLIPHYRCKGMQYGAVAVATTVVRLCRLAPSGVTSRTERLSCGVIVECQRLRKSRWRMGGWCECMIRWMVQVHDTGTYHTGRATTSGATLGLPNLSRMSGLKRIISPAATEDPEVTDVSKYCPPLANAVPAGAGPFLLVLSVTSSALENPSISEPLAEASPARQ